MEKLVARPGPAPGPNRVAEDRPVLPRAYFPLNVCISGTAESTDVIFIPCSPPFAHRLPADCRGISGRPLPTSGRRPTLYRCFLVLLQDSKQRHDLPDGLDCHRNHLPPACQLPAPHRGGRESKKPASIPVRAAEGRPLMPRLLQLQDLQERHGRASGRDLHPLLTSFCYSVPTSASKRAAAARLNPRAWHSSVLPPPLVSSHPSRRRREGEIRISCSSNRRLAPETVPSSA